MLVQTGLTGNETAMAATVQTTLTSTGTLVHAAANLRLASSICSVVSRFTIHAVLRSAVKITGSGLQWQDNIRVTFEIPLQVDQDTAPAA